MLNYNDDLHAQWRKMQRKEMIKDSIAAFFVLAAFIVIAIVFML
jgi:hypothetical protein